MYGRFVQCPMDLVLSLMNERNSGCFIEDESVKSAPVYKFAHCRSILGTLGHSSLWCYSSLSQHLNILLKSSSGCEDMKEVVSVILSRKFKLPTRTVVEDIGMGLAAAEVAGMKCIVTKSRYTAEEDFQNAYANFDFFGDSPEERFYLGTCGSLLSNSNSL